MRETEFIELIKKKIPKSSEFIGDDTAFILDKYLFCSDALVEKTHFLIEEFLQIFGEEIFKSIGYKAVAINVSDIVSSGGIPTFFTLSIGIPQYLKPQQIIEILEGINIAVEEFEVILVGGDTVRSELLFLDVAMIGEVMERPITRQGVKPKDKVILIGTLGISDSVLRKALNGERHHNESFVKHFLFPKIYKEEVKKLIKELNIIPSAMIDVSDGLSKELWTIAKENNIRIKIYKNRLEWLYKEGISWESILHGGEEYSLLVFSEKEVPENIGKVIGEVEGFYGGGIVVLDDEVLPSYGWEHVF